MATATEKETTKDEGTQTPPAGQTPPPATPDPKAQAGAAGTEVVEKTPPPKKDDKGGEPAKTEGKSAKPLGADEDLPEDDDLVQLSSRALKQRLSRATARELKERFGTTDTDSIKAKLEKLEKLETAEEERRRAALAKEERLEEDRKKAEERASAAERKLALAENERVVDRQEVRLKDIAGDYITPKAWKYVKRDLAEHMRDNYTPEQMAGLKDKDLKKWFTDYAKENPEFAKAVEATKETLSNGVKDDGRPSQKGAPNMAEKTFRPGQPNSMTRAEMAKHGINY